MKNTYLLLLVVICISISSCGDSQSKSEIAVKDHIKKYATYPKSYEPIEFLDLVKIESSYLEEYDLGHMFRIKGANGINKVSTHTFRINVINGKYFVITRFLESWE